LLTTLRARKRMDKEMIMKCRQNLNIAIALLPFLTTLCYLPNLFKSKQAAHLSKELVSGSLALLLTDLSGKLQQRDCSANSTNPAFTPLLILLHLCLSLPSYQLRQSSSTKSAQVETALLLMTERIPSFCGNLRNI